ncbi:hypothetical protein F5X96DRAFT_672699 [Biscogniauxia mediterranea]|nr:hypothetical protein F5X96DRAFT_672699 [Biscogniauxia mediterranea]
MEFIHPTYVDDIINAYDNMLSQPAEAMATSIPMRIFQEVTNQLQQDLEISPFQSYLIILFLAIFAAYLLGKLIIWVFHLILHTIRNTIQQCLPREPAMSWSSSSSTPSNMADKPAATKQHEDAQVPTTSPAMQSSNEVVLQQPQQDSNHHGSGPSSNSRAPSSEAVVVTYHRIHKHRGGQKYKVQRQKSDRYYYQPTRDNAPGGAGGIQVFLSDHAKMYAYTSGYNANDMAWVVIGTVVAVLVIAFLIKG